MSIWQLKTDSSRCSNIHTKFKSMTLRHFNFLCYSTPMSNPWDDIKQSQIRALTSFIFCLNFEAHENVSETLSCCRFAFDYLREVLPVFFHLCTVMNGRSWAKGGRGMGWSFCRLPYRLFFPLRMLYSSSYQCYFVWLVLLEKWTERQNIWVKFSNNEIKRVMAIFFPESFS